MIARRPDWEVRLSAYLAERFDAIVFEWGASDCALYTADAVLAMTDADIAARFRGKYSTAAGSAKALRKYGAGTLKDTFDTLLPPKPVGYARRGDVVMHDGAVGICIGADALFMRLPEAGPGLERIPRPDWSHAWSVG
ncbi:hypothetical protein SLG_22210 [Sphingobium sp. SYK-6]|uniref:DUF6950 family protein n=1 Tax=Sphingobium sp. (strain NBRC 103272 / SYK-6) TaxID=627192 RepID=UPI000227713C|nr:hypothetical protein [Sphingobium sp. SYK-6]BAK66896.1 hypothetical protein SLG_22210 [Sphingobium sp. SYK-6]